MLAASSTADTQGHVIFEDQTIRFADSDTSRVSDDGAVGISKSRTISGYEWTRLTENSLPGPPLEEEETPSTSYSPILESEGTSGRNSVTLLLGSKRRRFSRPREDGIAEDRIETSELGFTTSVSGDRTRSPSPVKKRRTLQDVFCGGIRRIVNNIYALVQGETENNETDDVEYGPVRYVPHSLSFLTRKTNFTKEELKTMYRTFKNECPTGVAYEDTFKSIYSQFFPSGDANMYAHYLFNAFDENQEGFICFEEFVSALSSLLRGKFEEKLQWIFKLYDINHDGFITRDEMQDIVKSVYSLLGPPSEGGAVHFSCIEHANRVFQKLDQNNDGYVTYPEFVEVCIRDPTVMASLKIFDPEF